MKKRKCLRIGWIALCGLSACGGTSCAGEDDPTIDDKPVSQWVKQLRSENRGIQLRAAQSLAKAPADVQAKIVPKLIPILKSERENDRFVAAQALGEYGSKSRSAVPDLLPMLEGTQYERNRAAAAKALGQIFKDAEPGDEVEKVTQALIKAFGDGYGDVRREAVQALGMIGPAAKSSIKHLAPMIREFVPGVADTEHFMVRRAAAWTCGRMGPLAAEHMDLLISRMHAEGERCTEIVEAMGLIGPVHGNVIPNIIDKIEICTSDGNMWGFRTKGVEALGRFGEKSLPALPLVKRMLHNYREALCAKIAMVKFVGGLGPAAKDLAPEILGQIQFAAGQDPKDEQAKTLKEEAAKAYKAVTGQDPPVKK